MADSTCIKKTAACAAAAVVLLLSGFSKAAEPSFNLYYKGQESLVLDRLKLDPSTHRVPRLAEARSAVFQGLLPPVGPELLALRERLEAGMGVVVILGPDIDPKALAYLSGGAIVQTATVSASEGAGHFHELERLAAVIKYVGPKDDLLADSVSWRSASRVHERSILTVRGATVMVTTAKETPLRPKTPVLVRVKAGKGILYVLNVWLRQGDQTDRVASYLELLKGIKGARNYDFQRWAGFNWLLYYLSRSSAKSEVSPYGRWIAAPVPDAHQVVLMAGAFLAAIVLLCGAFLSVRRYSMSHPEVLDHFYIPGRGALEPASLGAAALPAAKGTKGPGASGRGDTRWELVGFHRPLSGALYDYLLSILVMIPFNFVATFYLERNFINPFVEARGAWAAVTQFMLFFFTLLDVGTSQAMVKYFAEFRVKEPRRAICYAQFFIWFQALSGILQIAAFGMVAAIWMPGTAIAFMTWLVILHALIQFPGFISIFFNLFRALQRFDYAQLLIVLLFVLNPLVQMVCAIYMRHWGLLHPVFGEGIGAVFGFALGGIGANLLMGLFCAVFYHKVGFRLVTIFMAHFDRDTVRRSLAYGAKLTIGQLAGALSWGAIPLIMGALLPNFLELNELWLLNYGLTFAYVATGAYIFLTLMPSISESYSHKKLALTRRYLDQGLRWGTMIFTMMGGAYLILTSVLIQGLLPPQFLRALSILALIHLWRAADFTTRLPDQVFQAAGRTGLFTLTAVIEYAARIVLAWYLIKWYGFPGLMYAFILSSLLKSAVAWPLMSKMILRPVLSPWQTLLNPILAAIGNYLILDWIATMLWLGPGHTLNSFAVVLICLFGSLPVYMFLTGLLGWDRATLSEFRIAAELVPPPFRALAKLSHKFTEWGCHLSPLHDRFHCKLEMEAAGEAQELTEAKVAMG